MPVQMKLKTSFGEIEVQNIEGLSWGASRPPMVNHELGMKNHNLEPIVVRRLRSLSQNGKNDSEAELVKLAAALGEKAYFSGTIHIYMPTDMNNPVQTITFDRGHLVGIHPSVGTNEIEERLDIVTTNLKVGDSKFELARTT